MIISHTSSKSTICTMLGRDVPLNTHYRLPSRPWSKTVYYKDDKYIYFNDSIPQNFLIYAYSNYHNSIEVELV